MQAWRQSAGIYYYSVDRLPGPTSWQGNTPPAIRIFREKPVTFRQFRPPDTPLACSAGQTSARCPLYHRLSHRWQTRQFPPPGLVQRIDPQFRCLPRLRPGIFSQNNKIRFLRDTVSHFRAKTLRHRLRLRPRHR